MKHHAATLLALLLVPPLCVRANGESSGEPSNPAVTTIIVWDTSPSTKPIWEDLDVLAGQTVSALKPGDRLEAVSAHRAEGRLRVSQLITSADNEETATINTLLKNIRRAVFYDADVAAALELAFQRLDGAICKQRPATAVAIVLTDGQLQNDEVERILHLAALFRARGWGLYLTGTSKTTRRLLIAASQGKLRWSLIDRAEPSSWLAEARKAPRKGETYISAKESAGRASAEGRSPKSGSLYERPAKQGQRATEKEHLGGTAVVGTSTPKKRIPHKTTRDDKADEPFRGLQGPRKRPDGKRPDEQKTQSTWQLWWSRIRRPLYRPWVLVSGVGAVAAALLAAVLFKGVRACRQWRRRVTAKLKNTHQKARIPRLLTARVNGQTYRLGELGNFRAIHVGSGVNNTIRVVDKSVAERHLKLYRKRHGMMLRNLARSPILINSTEIKPRHKRRLVVPATVKLSDSVTLHLNITRQTQSASAGKG